MYERDSRASGDHPRNDIPSHPRPDEIEQAIGEAIHHDVPGTPPLRALKTLAAAGIGSFNSGEREVLEYSITKGRPRHGEMRSDDHIGSYQALVPLARVSREAFEGEGCPECNCGVGIYEYGAHHHISGGEGLNCARCKEPLYDEEW